MKRILLGIAVTALLLVPVALADVPGGSAASAAWQALQKTGPDLLGKVKTYRQPEPGTPVTHPRPRRPPPA